LTIVQDRTGSFGPHAPDLAFTKRLLRRYAPRSYIADRPSRVEGGWTPDLFVFHPDLPDVHGRPGWLAADEKRRLKTVELPRLIGAGPVLAQAFHFKDDDPAIPADQYLLTPGARGLNFFLRPGRYRIRLETLNELVAIGEVQV
jgi:hypothetical protein